MASTSTNTNSSPTKMPAVAQLRAMMNKLKKTQDEIARSLAALSTYAQEGHNQTIWSECRYLRSKVNTELTNTIQNLEVVMDSVKVSFKNNQSTLQKLADFKVREVSLNAEIKRLKEEDLTLSIALDEVETSTLSFEQAMDSLSTDICSPTKKMKIENEDELEESDINTCSSVNINATE